jgi:Fe-S-cluster containining protein
MNIDEQKKLVTDVKSGKQKTIGMNDKFKFDCTMCGKCCFNNEVLMNSYDMIRLRHALGFTTQEIIQNQLVNLYIGPSSGLPVLTINFKQDMGKLTKCPFLSPALKIENVIAKIQETIKDKDQLEKIKEEYKKDPKNLLKYMQGISIDRWLCAVHADRPLICRFFPCGRIKEVDRDNNQTKESWIFQEEAKDYCPGMSTNKEQTLADFLTASNFKQFDEGSAKFQLLMKRLVESGFFAATDDNKDSKDMPLFKTNSVPMVVIGNVLYNFDSFKFFSEDERVKKTITDKVVKHEEYMYVFGKICSMIETLISKYNEIDFSQFTN